MDLQQADVVSPRLLQDPAALVRGDSHEVVAVLQPTDVEGLTGDRLDVGVAPPRWQSLAQPDRLVARTRAVETDLVRLPHRPGPGQVDRVGRRETERLLLTQNHPMARRVELVVLRDILQVPVVMALAVVELKRADDGRRLRFARQVEELASD